MSSCRATNAKPATAKDKKPPLTDAEKIARAIMVGVFSRLVSK